ncbi:MAG: prepilin-type N-terminal cleavage/methylation domain-containing protein [Gemmatimonadetes bacterium]|nr:prepilin-type N-terminal cleavage/methylation domain-containing protein [Gemmatimonadota bacterium]
MSTNPLSKRGFTLIELLVVVVIVGLLAAIVGPQFSLARERTYVSVMITDLRNFATAEESYFYDFATYASDPATVQVRGFETSQGVSLTVNEATSSGWSATASHIGTPQQCYMYLGSAAPIGSADSEGVVACS